MISFDKSVNNRARMWNVEERFETFQFDKIPARLLTSNVESIIDKLFAKTEKDDILSHYRLPSLIFYFCNDKLHRDEYEAKFKRNYCSAIESNLNESLNVLVKNEMFSDEFLHPKTGKILPAISCFNGIYHFEVFYKDNIEHRSENDLPALKFCIFINQIHQLEWWQKGKLHRTSVNPKTQLTLPAVCHFDFSTKYGEQQWWCNGQLHRQDKDPVTGEDLPAIIQVFMTHVCYRWFQNGVETKTAVERPRTASDTFQTIFSDYVPRVTL